MAAQVAERDARGDLWAVFHAVDKTIRPDLIELLDRSRSKLGMTRARRDRRGAAR